MEQAVKRDDREMDVTHLPSPKQWSKPTLTVHSIEDLTQGVNAVTNVDGPDFFS